MSNQVKSTSLSEEIEREPELSFSSIRLFSSKLWPYIRNYKFLFFKGLLFVFLSILTSLALPWILGVLVDKVFVPKESKYLIFFAILYLFITIIKTISTFAQTYILTELGQNVLHDLRQDLFKRYLFYPISEFSKIPTGRMVTRLINDTSSLQDLFTGGIAVALADALIILGMIIWMLVIHPRLGIVCISVFPLMMLISIRYGAKLRETFRQSRAALSKLNSFLAENISGMWLIQLLNKEEKFKDKFDNTSKAYTLKLLNTVQNFSIFQPMITVLSALSMSIMIWYGGYLSIHQTGITLGILVAFMSYLQAMFAPIRDIIEKFNLFVSALASCEKIFEFMNRQSEASIELEDVIIRRQLISSNQQSAIEFQNVSFKYQSDSTDVLKNISFQIKSGEKIGIVGHTGAGKTTITQILLKFYDEYSGSIKIFNNELKNIEKRMIRSMFGYIQQDPFLFSGTIHDNIFLWNENNISKFHALPDFIKEPFLQGSLLLNREVVERGNNLSAGERQMIAYLRAMIIEPEILILDEATAHVDLLTERWINNASEYFFKNKIVIIIAHRLATFKNVDRIFVFHHGELIEQGTHLELLSLKKMYFKLAQIQSMKEQLVE